MSFYQYRTAITKVSNADTIINKLEAERTEVYKQLNNIDEQLRLYYADRERYQLEVNRMEKEYSLTRNSDD